MIIRYRNGYTVEGLLLARTHDTMRVAIPGVDDTVEFQRINEWWVSDDCEPVYVEFDSADKGEEPPLGLEYRVCSREVGAHLLDRLFYGEEVDVDRQGQNSAQSKLPPICQRVD